MTAFDDLRRRRRCRLRRRRRRTLTGLPPLAATFPAAVAVALTFILVAVAPSPRSCLALSLQSSSSSPPSPSSPPPPLDRRSALRTGLLGIGSAASGLFLPGGGGGGNAAFATPELDGYDPLSSVARPSAGRSYFPPLTPPLTDRATYRYDLGRDAYALEQLLVFANVSATVRTIVIRKGSTGGLWVCGPQYPTGEYTSLLDELGVVEDVVLPCNALEHKAPVGAFVRRYPKASVWVTPGQYGPFGTCGMSAEKGKGCKMGYRVDGVLPPGRLGKDDGGGGGGGGAPPLPPWSSEFEAATLYVSLPENAGPVSEAAFLHRPTRTLITTDSVVYVPEGPAPPIFSTYFDPGYVADRDFWPKSVLQAVFLPLRRGDDYGDDPSATDDDRWPGYASVRSRLVRAPILRAFADARSPDSVRSWVRDVSDMGEFDRILTSHFASPIRATPGEYRDAFSYLDGDSGGGGGGGGGSGLPPIKCGDWALLDGLNDAIDANKLGAPVVFDFKRGCTE